jgi:3alpha(or 20beta)-hydroxysteroid dehydrogenase
VGRRCVLQRDIRTNYAGKKVGIGWYQMCGALAESCTAASSGYTGEVVLITGGSRNQGLGHGRLLASEGAKVILADVADADGNAAVKALADGGTTVRYMHLDVTDAEGWHSVVADIMAKEGRLDVLVNNAAVLGKSGLADCALAEWEDVLRVNQTGPFLGIQHVVPAMRVGGRGSIINISSVIGNFGTEFNFAYSVSKAAVQMITRAAAVTLAPHIRVNTIIPGAIDTDMFQALPEAIRRQRLAAYPMGRPGMIEEVSKAVLFLASDESSFTTGGEIRVDGGALAGVKQRASI